MFEAPAALPLAAPLFAALGDPHRLALAHLLSTGGPTSLSALSAEATISRQAVSKHLQVLAAAGLATSTRLGRETIWAFEAARLAEVRQALDLISQRWDDALGRLKAFVEAP